MIRHCFQKLSNNIEKCVICGATRENYFSTLLYSRNDVDYANYEPVCISIENLNKDFERLEF